MNKENKPIRGKTKNPTSGTWTVRGVTPETREAAKKAARRAGVPMGAWIDETLRLAATDTLKDNLPAQRMEEQLASISNKLDAMQRPFWERLFGRRN
jgi:localization factor PodJL